MRIVQANIVSLLLIAALAKAQSPPARMALPDSAAIAKYSATNHERALFHFRLLRLGSWQFVWDDSTERHYGPTAQEFFAAFGSDSTGTIGSAEGTSPADVDGIMMIAIQALENRTLYLRAALWDKDDEIKDLRSQLAEVKAVAWKMRAALRDLYLNNVRLQNRLEKIERDAETSRSEISSLK